MSFLQGERALIYSNDNPWFKSFPSDPTNLSYTLFCSFYFLLYHSSPLGLPTTGVTRASEIED